MRRFMVILCAFLILAAFAPVFLSVYAAEDGYTEETLWPGIDFKSVAEFEGYLNDCHQKNSFVEIGEYYSTISGVYIPKAFKRHSAWISNVAAESYSYYQVHYTFEDTVYQFGTYYHTKSGQMKYEEWAKALFDNKDDYPKYKPQKHELNGYTIYSYYVLGETYYYWLQDGVYHYLRVNKNPRDRGVCLEYCDAEILPLNIRAAAKK